MYTVRRVLAHEYEKYREHLKALDENSKYLRFGYYPKDELIDQLCDRIDADKENHVLFCVEGDDLEFIGVGHIALIGTMELAFSVLKPYQGQGIGNALMRRSIQWCRTHNILKGNMVCLTSNSAIRHLCAKYGMKMKNYQGETLTEFDFDYAGFDTYMQEVADKNLEMIDWVAKRATKFLKNTIQIS